MITVYIFFWDLVPVFLGFSTGDFYNLEMNKFDSLLGDEFLCGIFIRKIRRELKVGLLCLFLVLFWPIGTQHTNRQETDSLRLPFHCSFLFWR